MKKPIICTTVFLITGVVSWLLLSYFFFPIKLSAPMEEYFTATMTHMMAFKFIVSLIFCLGASFIVDMKLEKRLNMENDDMEKE